MPLLVANAPSGERSKIEAALALRVPRPTAKQMAIKASVTVVSKNSQRYSFLNSV
jgi:hypothetical protein